MYFHICVGHYESESGSFNVFKTSWNMLFSRVLFFIFAANIFSWLMRLVVNNIGNGRRDAINKEEVQTIFSVIVFVWFLLNEIIVFHRKEVYGKYMFCDYWDNGCAGCFGQLHNPVASCISVSPHSLMVGTYRWGK